MFRSRLKLVKIFKIDELDHDGSVNILIGHQYEVTSVANFSRFHVKFDRFDPDNTILGSNRTFKSPKPVKLAVNR